MKRNLSVIVFGLAAVLVVLAGCGPGPTTPDSDDPGQAFTAAAETIVAQLTDLALTMQPSTPTNGTPVPPLPTAAVSTPTTAIETPTDEATPEEEELTETVTPELTPTYTPEPSSVDPRGQLGEADFVDNFESAANWPLYNDGSVSFSIQDGELLMRAFNPVGWDGWMVTRPVLEDFFIEISASFRVCNGLDRYGLLVRASDPSANWYGYLVGISCDGRYSLRHWNGPTSSFTPLIDWTASEHIRSGANEVNRLGLWAEGNRLVVYVNGYQLGEVQDNRQTTGRFGVFIGSINTVDLTVEADEVAYWVLP
ncbi:MAG: hypothetical protein IBX69_10425 [Anaerolineales bacterium]|nr:hypothetical protein [Anaerolineales bacterium]